MDRDLFENETADGPSEYRRAIESWLTQGAKDGRLRHGSSTEMYEHMWGAWTTWAVGRGLGLDAVAAGDLDAYLQSRGGSGELSNRYAWRFLRLIDRVLSLRSSQLGADENTAASDLMKRRPDIRYANAADADPPPEFLPVGQAKDLVTYLSAVRPGRASVGLAWQEIRNRTSVALMLGGGLTPGEVRALRLDDAVIDGAGTKGVPWKLRIAGNGNAPARETPVAAWSGQLLKHWMQIREEQRIPGPMMFASTRSTGKPWGKVAQYNAAKEVLRAAGVDGDEGGSFKLRHTFALRQLRRGKTPDEVARWLGVTDPSVMARYRRVIAAPVDLA